MYKFICLCSKEIMTRTREGICPACKRGYKLEWEAPYTPPTKVRTVAP